MVTHGSDNKFGNFDLVTSVKLDYADIQVSKWRSRVTGLSLVHLDYNGTYLVLILSGCYYNSSKDIDI